MSVLIWAKGRARHIPPQTDTSLGLLRNMPCSFCVIWVERNATKATTRNGVPQGKERPQHTPSQTDTVVRFVQEHVAVF